MDYYKRKLDMKDINYTLELDFFESIHGCTKKIKVSYYKICDICNGIGMINSTICPDCKMKLLNQENFQETIEPETKETNTNIKQENKQDLEQTFNISSELSKDKQIQELNFDKDILNFETNEDNKNSLDTNKDILHLDHFDLNSLQNDTNESLGIGLLKQNNDLVNIKVFNQESTLENNKVSNKNIKQELKQGSKNKKICEKCHNTGYIFLSNCPICNNGLKQAEKEVEITVQPRCDESTRYIIKNFNKGANGGKNGNLIINFKIKNDTKFKIINDYDIQYKLDVNMKDAIFGKVFAVPTIYQKYYKLTIPKLTQQGTKITIKHLGLLKETKISDKNPMNNYGNMIIKINILIPTNLNEKQLKVLKQIF